MFELVQSFDGPLVLEGYLEPEREKVVEACDGCGRRFSMPGDLPVMKAFKCLFAGDYLHAEAPLGDVCVTVVLCDMCAAMHLQGSRGVRLMDRINAELRWLRERGSLSREWLPVPRIAQTVLTAESGVVSEVPVEPAPEVSEPSPPTPAVSKRRRKSRKGS